MFDAKKKGQTEPLAPWLLLVMLIFIVILAIVAYLKVTALIYADKSKTTDYALHSMLESTDCTPNTKRPLRDVLAIGIGEGKTSVSFGGDTIQIDYGGKSDGVQVAICLNTLKNKVIVGDSAFYVEHPILCPPSYFGGPGCYGETAVVATDFNVISSEYIALPNGDVGKAVLMTKG